MMLKRRAKKENAGLTAQYTIEEAVPKRKALLLGPGSLDRFSDYHAAT